MKYCQQCGAQLEEEMSSVYIAVRVRKIVRMHSRSRIHGTTTTAVISLRKRMAKIGLDRTGKNMNCQNNGFQNNNAAGYGQMPGPYGGGSYGIERRSIPLSVILTIVTCGLYGLYWIIKLK
mgnify:CR=1 FL=1